jgi:hypothetical protein
MLTKVTRTKVIFGFLILALGMMLTDVFRLASAQADISVTHGVEQAKF